MYASRLIKKGFGPRASRGGGHPRPPGSSKDNLRSRTKQTPRGLREKRDFVSFSRCDNQIHSRRAIGEKGFSHSFLTRRSRRRRYEWRHFDRWQIYSERIPPSENGCSVTTNRRSARGAPVRKFLDCGLRNSKSHAFTGVTINHDRLGARP